MYVPDGCIIYTQSSADDDLAQKSRRFLLATAYSCQSHPKIPEQAAREVMIKTLPTSLKTRHPHPKPTTTTSTVVPVAVLLYRYSTVL